MSKSVSNLDVYLLVFNLKLGRKTAKDINDKNRKILRSTLHHVGYAQL